MKKIPRAFRKEDELRAANAVLRLKLEMEHGLEMHQSTVLDPQIENQWLKNIQAFEEQFERAERISVYDFIGKPPFPPRESLTPDQLPEVIAGLIAQLHKNGIALDFCCHYDDDVIYRFITTEFFAHKIDNIHIEGGAHFFSYEEFHPNHDYTLRTISTKFAERVLSKQWCEFDNYMMSDSVSFHGQTFTRSGISSIISFFQCCHSELEMRQITIQNVHVDIENRKAAVRADLIYSAGHPGMESELIEGPCIIHFELGEVDWDIIQFDIPSL